MGRTGGSKYKSLVGKKINCFTIIGLAEMGRLLCRCECGTIRKHIAVNVLRGDVKSCGCYGDKNRSKSALTHGGSGTRLYRTWQSMIDRCYNPNNNHYNAYGARGVRLCDAWRHDFAAFRDWATQNGYADELTIDRIDPYGNYHPNNCRWIPMSQQGENRCDPDDRQVKYRWNINGVVHTARTWCKLYGLSYPMVLYRVTVKGMEPIDALTKPKHFMYRGE